MSGGRKGWFGAAFAVVNAAVLAFVLLREPDLALGLSVFTGLDFAWAAACIALAAAFLLLAALALYESARGCGGRVSALSMIRAELCSRFYVMVSPLGAAGQPMYVYQLTRSGLSSSQATAAVAARFVANQAAFQGAYLAAAMMMWRGIGAWARTAVTLSLTLNLWMLAFIILVAVAPRPLLFAVRQMVRLLHALRVSKDPDALEVELFHGVAQYAQHFRSAGFRTVAVSFALCALQALCFSCFAPCVYFALGLSGVPAIELAALSLVVMSAVAFVPTPGNAGGAEGAFYALLGGPFGYANRLSGMLAWRTLSYYLPLVASGVTLGIWMLSTGVRRKRAQRSERLCPPQ